MKRKLNDKRTIFTALMVLGLIFIFFVGRYFNPETGKRNFILTPNWISHFRRWLDVSWWTKLVFKISYDKYEEIYKWAELASIKSTIEKIILKNIDNRISALWVSDYKAYVQNMDNNPYIVVEIWWVADLDQAKEIIGKTVELEFRLPKEWETSEAEKAQRKELAINLKKDIELSEWKIDKFADSRGSQNIFYNNVTGVTLSQLPKLFKDNPKLLNLSKWEISDIVTDLFDIVEYQDLSGKIHSEELQGYTFYRINDVKEVSRENISLEDILDIANQLSYKYDQKISKSDESKINTYDFVWNDLVYHAWLVAENQSAYNVKIVQVANNSTIGWEIDLEQLNKEREGIVKNVEANIKTKDQFDWWELLVDGRVPELELKSMIPDFDASLVWSTKTYSQMASDYVVYLAETKDPNENLVSQLVVKNVNKNHFEEKMKSKLLYDMEIVFVQDKETWKTAQTSKWDILNGAYFKFANVSQSQIGLPVVVINFDDKWKEIFCDITAENISKQMAIFVGWEMLTSPTIQSKICGGTAQIDWNFTAESAKELVDSLNDWALPAPLILMQEEKIAPTLGDSALQWALLATLVWILAMYVYMYINYWFKKAMVTLWVLIYFLIITAFIIKLIDYALSLSWIAAVILSLWMAIDANILIYERQKEEEAKWKTQNSSIDVAYTRSRPAIRDGNISTGIIALFLFMLGSNIFKWFGFMLMVTVAITLIFNVPLIKMLLKFVYRKK
jgi:protein-export membrane protein SecD